MLYFSQSLWNASYDRLGSNGDSRNLPEADTPEPLRGIRLGRITVTTMGSGHRRR